MSAIKSAAMLLTALHGNSNTIDMGKAKAMLASVLNADATNDQRTHALAVAAIQRSLPMDAGGHLDCSLASRLVNGLAERSRRVRVKALAAWFAAYSNIRLVRDDKSGVYAAKMLTPKSQQYRADIAIGDALATPFWSVEEASTDPKAFSLADSLARLIKRAAKEGAELSAGDKAIFVKIEKLVPAS